MCIFLLTFWLHMCSVSPHRQARQLEIIMQIAQVSPGKLVTFRSGSVGRYEGRCPLTQRHRVTAYSRRGQPVHPSHIGDGQDVQYTVWLIADDGRCRGDKADSQLDFAGTAA
jgi:hypothetical protein